jgi:hypothetical protein
MKKIIRLTESDLARIVKRVISEQTLADTSMGGVMSLQKNILAIEISKGTARFIGDPQGCKPPYYYNIYSQGQTNQCKIEGTSLCNGPCFQKQAMDGQYGNLTKAAYTKYKDEPWPGDETITMEVRYDGTGGYELKSDWRSALTANWQIPANMTNIKAFQWYVWRKIEANAEKDPNSCDSEGKNCSYKSILCGNTSCKKEKAVDGSWGTNTKKAWMQYRDRYFDDGWKVSTTYDEMPDSFN